MRKKYLLPYLNNGSTRNVFKESLKTRLSDGKFTKVNFTTSPTFF